MGAGRPRKVVTANHDLWSAGVAAYLEGLPPPNCAQPHPGGSRLSGRNAGPQRVAHPPDGPISLSLDCRLETADVSSRRITMTVRVGINGFGRIGRQSLRAIMERYPDRLQVVALNDIADLQTNVHLFKHDSNYGAFPGRVEARDSELRVNDWAVKVFSEREPDAIRWKEAGGGLLVGSTGRGTAAGKARGHLTRGAKQGGI